MPNGFFYVHLVVLVATWSLPPATFNYQNCQNSQKCVQRLSRSLPQLPATTKIVQIFKSVYWVANYHQLPSATIFFFLNCIDRQLPQLPSTTFLGHFFESVYLVASYLQLPGTTYFHGFQKSVYLVACYLSKIGRLFWCT